MREVGGPVERVYIPAEVAAGFPAAAFLPDQVMVRPPLADALHDQLLRSPVGFRDQIGLALVFDGDLAKAGHEQRTGFARQFLHWINIVVGLNHQRLRRPPSSAMCMISCLKMK